MSQRRTYAGAAAGEAVAVDRCCGGGGLVIGRGRKRKKKVASDPTRDRTGKPSPSPRPWTISSWKMKGSGLQISGWWAFKEQQKLAQGRLARGRLA